MRLGNLNVNHFLYLREAKLSLYQRGAMLVVGENRDEGGSNWSGKSTLVNAPLWALTGQTILGVKGTNVCMGKRASVDQDIEIQGNWYTVQRAIEGKKHLLTVIDKKTNQAVINARHVNDAQDALYRLIGMGREGIFNTCFVGQGADDSFSSLTSANQKEIYESMLSAEIFSAARDKIAESHKKALALKTTTETNLSTLKGSIETLRQNRTSAEGQMESHGAELERKRNEVCGQLSEAQDNYKDAYDAHSVAVDLQINLREELRFRFFFLALSCFPLPSMLATVEALQQKSRELSRDLLEAATKRGQKEGELERTQNLINSGQCPTCGAPTADNGCPSEHLQTVVEGAHKAIQDLKGLEEQLTRVKDETKTTELVLEQSYLDTKGAEDLRDDCSSRLVEAMDFSDLSLQITSSRKTYEDGKNILEKQLSDLADETNPFIQTITDLDGQLAETTKAITTEEASLTGITSLLANLDFWLRGFGQGGLRSRYLGQVTPYLNSRVQRYITPLIPGAKIGFETIKETTSKELRDNFHVKVDIPHGSQTYAVGTGGEKQCIDVAVALALQDLCSATGGVGIELSIMDEVCRYLDPVRSAQVVGLLSTLTERGTILVVSNSNDFIPYFKTIVRVIKEDGWAHVE